MTTTNYGIFDKHIFHERIELMLLGDPKVNSNKYTSKTVIGKCGVAGMVT